MTNPTTGTAEVPPTVTPMLSREALREMYEESRQLFLTGPFIEAMRWLTNPDRVYTPPEILATRADLMIGMILDKVIPAAWSDWNRKDGPATTQDAVLDGPQLTARAMGDVLYSRHPDTILCVRTPDGLRPISGISTATTVTGPSQVSEVLVIEPEVTI